ncbi:MAG: hypothetical protein U5Q03_02305 [Bacteroidota bacterium]|nr:hypothetical protein [Bacteroidota bacterium]
MSYEKEDNNVFFTALIVMTLREIEPYVSLKSREIIDSIAKRALKVYPEYRNKDGFAIYNFWQTNPSRHFPNDAILSKFKKFKLPEDFDDTSIIYLSDEQDNEDKKWIRSEMVKHTNLHRFQVQNTFDKYHDQPAYSTWFGLNMPIDFDICVHANTMSMVYAYEFPLNRHDSATLFLIRDMILNDHHLNDAAYISPHYQKPEVILYHAARLVSTARDKSFEDLHNKLTADILNLLPQAETFMEMIILSSALMKLGVCPPENMIPGELESDIGIYHFFVANMASSFKDPWKKWLGLSDVFNFPYECEAYDYTLILENIALRKKLDCN